MPKMRKFKFDDGKEVKEVEALSFKKAVKSFQASSKAKMVSMEWVTKKGEVFVKEQKLPLGRQKKIGKQKKVEVKVTVSRNPLVKLLVRLRMWYADFRGHHGRRWDYEPSEHYMGRGKKKDKQKTNRWLIQTV